MTEKELSGLVRVTARDILFPMININENQRQIIIITGLSTTNFSIVELAKYQHSPKEFVRFIKEEIKKSIVERNK